MGKSPALISTVLALLAVALIAAACGSGGSSTTTGSVVTQPASTPTSTPATAAQDTLNTSPRGASAEGFDLTLVGLTEFSPGQPYATLGIACGPELVFASPNPTTTSYSASDLQAIRDYVTTVPLTQDGGYPIPQDRTPSALRWVSAGQGCAARFDIHNGSSQDVTISAVGLQIIDGPSPNTNHYALLDLCSISARFGACQSPSGAPDDGYTAHIGLGQQAAGAPAVGGIEANPQEPEYGLPLLLAKGQTKSISVRISQSDPNAPSSIYQAVPQLTVFDSATRVITFSGLRQRLVFSDTSQFACFGISGNAVVPPSQITYPAGTGAGC